MSVSTRGRPHRSGAGRGRPGQPNRSRQVNGPTVYYLYYAEHGVPYFHAVDAGEDASIAIDTLEVLAGSLPDRALRLVREWAALHRAELDADWRRARDGEALGYIPPLA